MKILQSIERLILMIFDALLAGKYIQMAGIKTGNDQIICYGIAVIFVCFCAMQMNRLVEEDE